MSTEVATTPVKTEEPTTTQVVEEQTTTAPVEETTAPETTAKTEEEAKKEEAPAPTPSKSSTTKRLSVFLGKAKNIVDKVVDKKPVPPKKDTTPAATEPEVAATTEPVAEEVHATEPAAEVTEEVAAPVTEQEKPKHEKRKSFLDIFRAKSPVQNKEAEKSEEVAATTEPVEPEQVVTANIVEEEVNAPVVEAPKEEAKEAHHKDNVIDSIRKGPLSKFFNKKKEEHAKEVEGAPKTTEETAPVATEPVVETAATEPVEESTATAPATEEKRPGSPLGRRLTHLIRGFTTKKKSPTEKKEEIKEEEVKAEEPKVEEPKVEEIKTEQDVLDHELNNQTREVNPAVQAVA